MIASEEKAAASKPTASAPSFRWASTLAACSFRCSVEGCPSALVASPLAQVANQLGARGDRQQHLRDQHDRRRHATQPRMKHALRAFSATPQRDAHPGRQSAARRTLPPQCRGDIRRLLEALITRGQLVDAGIHPLGAPALPLHRTHPLLGWQAVGRVVEATLLQATGYEYALRAGATTRAHRRLLHALQHLP